MLVGSPLSQAGRQMDESIEVITRNTNVGKINVWTECTTLGMDKMS